MSIKSSISLTDEQHAFVRDLVEAGRFTSVSAVLQQGIDLLKQKMLDDDLQRRALQALLEQRRPVRDSGRDGSVRFRYDRRKAPRPCGSELSSRQRPSTTSP
jgi:putative addiction module CopG family antidote